MPMKRRPIRITIPGDPIPWARPGQNKRRRFDTQDSQKYAVGLVVKAQMKASAIGMTRLCISVSYQFQMPIPKYIRQKIESEMKDGMVWHFIKPDVDNLIKFYGDAMQGILWPDDCRIASVPGEKFYSLKPRTVIEVSEL